MRIGRESLHPKFCRFFERHEARPHKKGTLRAITCFLDGNKRERIPVAWKMGFVLVRLDNDASIFASICSVCFWRERLGKCPGLSGCFRTS